MNSFIGGYEPLIVWALAIVLIVVPFWKILGRMGLPPILSVLFLVPVVNVIVLWFVAYAAWPAAGKPVEQA